MRIQAFPAVLQPVMQQGWLEDGFQESLRSKLAYRSIARREMIRNGIGETVTKTRARLKAVATTPLSPSSNTTWATV